jgi:hypothetical protein
MPRPQSYFVVAELAEQLSRRRLSGSSGILQAVGGKDRFAGHALKYTTFATSPDTAEEFAVDREIPAEALAALGNQLAMASMNARG